MLDRLERNEKEAKQMQLDREEEDGDDDVDDNVDDGTANLRASLTAAQIESASTETLLAMLTPKERQNFMDAIKDPQTAASLMDRLDRKAERRPRLEPSPSPQGVLVSSQSQADTATRQPKYLKDWQSLPWFDTPQADSVFLQRSPKHVDSFLASLEKILLAQRSSTQPQRSSVPVKLAYNLCAVLMAYAYTLRHLDVASLSARSKTLVSQQQVIPELMSAISVGEQCNDDEEPPPLEPDSPTSSVPGPPFPSATEAVPTARPDSQASQDTAFSEQAFGELNRLIPFLFTHPAPNSTKTIATAGADHSRLLLTSLDDTSMWLLSRLSLESEIGPAGADAIDLQLLQDLAKLLTHERLLPTFGEGQEVESRFWLVSKLASLSPQQAFTAAQTPLLLNAIADIYFFLDDLSFATSTTQLTQVSTRNLPKNIKMAQRKLCFYLGCALNADQQFGQSAMAQLDSELQNRMQSLRHSIGAVNEAEKIAAAVNLFSNASTQRSSPPSIEAAL
ncbi:hypothetical protein EX895_002138 [Sporisorium graminicola]|uniref:Uncharacterized protein n=1 Tax=Sporisorium graminicola TaxID=280036 RepID=A0A4U7KXD0_9BASI|nr:hypothetical protein EX895_002138 [Sporisorium graminicola]TKY88897.1 hypothetical protein EX895_002138 [Sporisorium graminicola]